MGTTIRRQPITNSIPSSPDYKFLNITNFGGTQKSSNPFVVSSNTASDCLNVYVDEDNALSTRPRLQLKYDLVSLANVPEGFETIGVYDLHDGYLLHGVVGKTGYMYRFVETEAGLQNAIQIKDFTDIPTTKCVVFEQNDVIYILSGSTYTKIDKQNTHGSIGGISAYIPTTTIGKWEPRTEKTSDGATVTSYQTSGKNYESLNVLNSLYNETYFWDGVWDYSPETLNAYDVENDYMKREFFIHGGRCQIWQFLPQLSDIENDVYCVLFYDYERDKIFFAKIDRQLNIIDNTEVNIPISIYASWTGAVSSPDGLVVAGNLTTSDKVSIRIRTSATSTSFTSVDTDVDGDVLYVSPNGLRIIVHKNNGTMCVLVKTSNTTYAERQITCADNDNVFEFGCTPNENGLKFILSREAKSFEYLDTTTDLTQYTTTTITLPQNTSIRSALGAAFSPKDDKFIISYEHPLNAGSSGTYAIYENPTKIFWHSVVYNSKDLPIEMMYSSSGNNIFCLTSSGSAYYESLILRLQDDFVKILPGFKLPILYWNLGYMKRRGQLVTDTTLWCWGEVDYEQGIQKLYLDVRSSEPLLKITRRLEEDNPLYSNFDKQQKSFRKAQLLQRFDNNTWFASGNTTFHTLYNDPTYIPLASYNDLGEDYEEITGLSIVNDNILAAYKRNKIYIITPITIGNELTYSYTETKNVVGNDVVGAPILTILTEMPTIVSYDGIYALNQLENVQSSDRITTLISENINPLWLKESKSDVDGCQTLNRLYWTYYMLPHEKVDDEKEDYTKVYLLDNRSQQWYYWELPMLVMDSMVRDNKTHLVDSEGRLFTLETSDLINEYNPDVTEYYDKVNDEKRIIPWHWYSQILSLNTINYSKKLIDTTFILTDTDTQDEYALDYNFIAWRKSVSETNATTISSNINYVQSTTKRTMIPRFNFIQIRLSNTEEDLDNNKLRLVGLGLKYVLLEGLY